MSFERCEILNATFSQQLDAENGRRFTHTASRPRCPATRGTLAVIFSFIVAFPTKVPAQLVVDEGNLDDVNVVGTLRWAVAQLADPNNTDTEITIDNTKVTSITLNDVIVYPESNKRLVIKSTGTFTDIAFNGNDDYALECWDRNGANLVGLNIDGSGILINIDASAIGTIHVDLERVYVWDGQSDGLTILDLNARGGAFLDVSLKEVLLIGNEEWGCYVRRDDGDLHIICDVFGALDNGAGRVAQGGVDGIEINQFGNGSVYAALVSCVFADNTEDAVDIEEHGTGNLVGVFDSIQSDRANEEGIQCVENGTGDLNVSVTDCDICDTRDLLGDDEGAGDAVDLQESGDGRCDVVIDTLKVLDGDGDGEAAFNDGIHIRPDGAGNACITITNCEIRKCRDDGIDFKEAEPLFGDEDFTGLADILIDNSTVTENVQHGMRLIPANSLDPPATMGCSGGVLNPGDTGILDIQGVITNYEGNGPDPDENLEPDNVTWTRFNLATQL